MMRNAEKKRRRKRKMMRRTRHIPHFCYRRICTELYVENIGHELFPSHFVVEQQQSIGTMHTTTSSLSLLNEFKPSFLCDSLLHHGGGAATTFELRIIDEADDDDFEARFERPFLDGCGKNKMIKKEVRPQYKISAGILK